MAQEGSESILVAIRFHLWILDRLGFFTIKS